jgi:plasmid rolling circle replication initiator protein Rep
MKTENQRCVNCDMEFNSDTEVTRSNDQPRANDLTICLYCGQPYYFDEQIKRVPLSKDQFRKLPAHDKQNLREAWDIRAQLIRDAIKKNPPGFAAGGNS